ncbi:MAG TPA: hypothetical protein VLG44_05330 [Chlamydiales bacterium]|nr:hypothetical protein [Chlamydiales bacterium]
MQSTVGNNLSSVLVLTSSGGGGLIQAANAKIQEVLRKNPNAKIIRKDLLKEGVWRFAGKPAIEIWNNSQKTGNIKNLERLIYLQKFAEVIIWPAMFLWMLGYIHKKKLDLVIDTQPLATSAILRAIRFYSWLKKKTVVFEKVIVDLPTSKATHYFDSIKKIPQKDKAFLRLITIPPLLENGETSEEFWQKNCALSEKNVCYQEYYIRQGFHPYHKLQRPKEDYEVEIAYKHPKELEYLKDICKKTKEPFQVQGNNVRFTIGKNDRLVTILLGSQPAYSATLNYVKNMVEVGKGDPTRKYHIFVFCADHTENAPSLFQLMHDLIIQMKDLPPNFSVIPLSFQDESVIASLFFRSDLTITRSGGQTSLELMCVMSGQKWIHSEAKKRKGEDVISREDLLKGIPGWEAGNACYLEQKTGARIVTPETVGDSFQEFIQ